jgi:hypothetical protein
MLKISGQPPIKLTQAQPRTFRDAGRCQREKTARFLYCTWTLKKNYDRAQGTVTHYGSSKNRPVNLIGVSGFSASDIMALLNHFWPRLARCKTPSLTSQPAESLAHPSQIIYGRGGEGTGGTDNPSIMEGNYNFLILGISSMQLWNRESYLQTTITDFLPLAGAIGTSASRCNFFRN